jgi:hypothetical protein
MKYLKLFEDLNNKNIVDVLIETYKIKEQVFSDLILSVFGTLPSSYSNKSSETEWIDDPCIPSKETYDYMTRMDIKSINYYIESEKIIDIDKVDDIILFTKRIINYYSEELKSEFYLEIYINLTTGKEIRIKYSENMDMDIFYDHDLYDYSIFIFPFDKEI